MTPVGDVARGKWRSILPMLGIDGRFLSGKHGPCPACGGKDRFRFTDYQQSGGYVCNACGKGDGVDLLCKVNGWSFPDCAREIRNVVGSVEADAPRPARRDTSRLCQGVWQDARTISRGDNAAIYLGSRKLKGPYSADLRFSPECQVTGLVDRARLPAMLALVRDPDGQPASVHRTYLDGGKKAAIESPRRMMPGRIAPGSAIRLAPYAGVLGIAEGIETALAVQRDFKIPCWAAANAQMLATFAWPFDLVELHIFGDHDLKFGGQAAAYNLAHRAATSRAAPRVQMHIPPTPGHDWLDHGNAEFGLA